MEQPLKTVESADTATGGEAFGVDRSPSISAANGMGGTSKARATSRGIPMKWTIRRARELTLSQYGLLGKTFCLLLVAKAALRLLPVRHIIHWKRTALKTGTRSTAEKETEQCRRIRWAVLVVARHSPIRFVCFPQCLAASALLRQHGIESRLHYGVARTGDRLETHTWLEAGGTTLIGGEVAGGFSTLAVY